jgi:peptidoglycan/LPS O-acetylase OafA/YrhL
VKAGGSDGVLKPTSGTSGRDADAARPTSGLGYFPAVDGLRAVAILSVLVYHLRPALLPGGFTGVDIFFVISGFVVTASLVHLRFESLGQLIAYFYARRIVRIVPALVAMLLGAASATILFIPPSPFLAEAEATALAASVGASNILLAIRDSGYFDPRQELNPFLHTWTLGVEEQFYLLFPFLFFFCRRALDDSRDTRRGVVTVLVLTALSLALAIGFPNSSELTFYLMPFRFWELGCGMLLCLTIGWWRPYVVALHPRSAFLASAGAVMALAATFSVPAAAPFPLIHLVPAVAATAALIALVCGRRDSVCYIALADRRMVYIGQISYSLYLWHWPVFVLFRWTIGLEGVLHAGLAVVTAFACAILSYILIEQPVRHRAKRVSPSRHPILAAGAMAVLACAGATWSLYSVAPQLSLSAFASTEEPFSVPPGCEVRRSERELASATAISWTPLCARSARSQKLVVVGDSHANTYRVSLPRLAAETGMTVELYPGPGCGLPSLTIPHSRRRWCRDFYGAVEGTLSRTLSPGDTLLMVSLHVPRIDRASPSSEGLEKLADRNAAWTEARALLMRLSGTGARIILQAPTPVFRSPPFRCLDWFNRRNPVCAGGFDIDREASLTLRRPALTSMQRLSVTIPNVEIWDPFPILCPRDPCSAVRRGEPLFKDADHVGRQGHLLLYPHLLQLVMPPQQR